MPLRMLSFACPRRRCPSTRRAKPRPQKRTTTSANGSRKKKRALNFLPTKKLERASDVVRFADEAGDAGRVADDIWIGSKIQRQMGKRGWTDSEVEDTITNPARTVPTRDTRHLPGGGRMDDPATAYMRSDGSYVVRNDKTGDVVQVSNRNDPNWKSPW